MREFIKKFVKYDADFEYGAELPEIFLKYVLITIHLLEQAVRRVTL